MSQKEQAQLKTHGINNTKDLLRQANTPQAKQELANKLKLKINYINKWVALADLARIPSVGDEYCGLLLHCGIGSVAQLIQTPIYRIHRQILRLQVATMQRQDLCPPLELVQQWINEAKLLK